MTGSDFSSSSIDEQSTECRWVRDQLPAYAIRALDAIDATRVDEHLLVCGPCDAERVAWDTVLPMLVLAAPASEPPAALKARITSATRISSRAQPIHAGQSTPQEHSTPVPPAAPRGRSWARFGSKFTLLPLIGLIMVLSLLTVTSQQQLGREQDRADRLERENAAISASLVVMQSGNAQNGSARIYPLLSVDESFAEAGGVVLGDPSQSTALLSVWNMPGDIGTYHVICESRLGELLAAGQFQVNDLGIGTVTLNLPGPMTEYRVVHIIHADDMAEGIDPRMNDVLLVRLEEPTALPAID